MATITYVVTSEIVEELRAARARQKRSQSAVARDLKASQTTIQKIETGQAKESSFLKELWLLYRLPLQRFEELQNNASAAPRAVTLQPSARAEIGTEAPPRSLQLADSEELSDAVLGQLVRRVTREELIRVVDGQVTRVLQMNQPAQIAIRLVRANGTDVKIVMARALAREMAAQIFRLDGDE